MITLRVRDQVLSPVFGDDLAQSVGVASLVGRQGGGLESLQQSRRSERVAELGGVEDEAERSSKAVGHHLDLGG